MKNAARITPLLVVVSLIGMTGVAMFIGQDPGLIRGIPPEGVVVTVKPYLRYQTMTGWEATAQAGQAFPSFPLFRDEVFDLAVNELGINRIRLEVRAGAENRQDYWTQSRRGEISGGQWRSHRYATANDNSDPMVIDWDGFQFSELDHKVESIVLPLKQRLEAKGEELYITVNYVAFTKQIGQGLSYIHDDPDEYAELVLATYLHLESKYGLTPDAWEVILEPDNVEQWNGELIGRAMVKAGERLEANGFEPAFIAPSTTSMANAPRYFDQLSTVPGALEHLEYLSYHRYGGVSDAALNEIASRAAQHGLKTAMLEHIGSGYANLHKDLKLGMVSAWQQYTLGYPAASDNGGAYFIIDLDDPQDPKVRLADRSRFLRQYFYFVRAGAQRIGAVSDDPAFDPVAFKNPDGGYVVVVKASSGGKFAVRGLSQGSYGVSYTSDSEYDVDLGAQDVGPGGAVEVELPEAGVVTIYARPAPDS